jgi:hypothetical protein
VDGCPNVQFKDREDWNTSHAFRHTPIDKGLDLPCIGINLIWRNHFFYYYLIYINSLPHVQLRESFPYPLIHNPHFSASSQFKPPSNLFPPLINNPHFSWHKTQLSNTNPSITSPEIINMVLLPTYYRELKWIDLSVLPFIMTTDAIAVDIIKCIRPWYLWIHW